MGRIFSLDKDSELVWPILVNNVFENFPFSAQVALAAQAAQAALAVPRAVAQPFQAGLRLKPT